MDHRGRFAHAVLLVSGIVLAVVGSGETKAAVAESQSNDLIPATVVLRGSATDAAQPLSVTSSAPVVLRGSPPAAAQSPVAQYACPSDYGYDPGHGCVTPDYAYNPYDYGVWSYYGFGFSSSGRRHGFSRGFVHDMRRGFAPRFGRHLANGFRRGFAHAGGFSRR